MEVVAFIIITSLLMFGIAILFVSNRNKNGLLFTLFLFFFILTFGTGDLLHIESLKLFSAIIGLLSFFLIPVLFEFKNLASKSNITESKVFLVNSNLEYANEIPKYIYNDILSKHGELDPCNKTSCFCDKSIFDSISSSTLYSITYDSKITCSIEDLNFYLIERNQTFKNPPSRKHNTGPSFYTLQDYICIIESQKPVNIPEFILKDRIPIVDTLKNWLEYFNNKCVDFSFDKYFNESYIVEGIKASNIKAYFNKYIRSTLLLNKLKDFTMKSTDNRLLIRFPRRISFDEIRMIFCIGCEFFKKDIDIFNSTKQINSSKSDVYDDEGSFLDYFKNEYGEYTIPPFLGGFIIFIISILIIMYFNTR